MLSQKSIGAFAVALTMIGSSAAVADDFTLRIGSGHPNGPAVYVADTADFFVPEVKRRVEEETDHTITFVEGYGGAIAGVDETLEAVQNGIDPFKFFIGWYDEQYTAETLAARVLRLEHILYPAVLRRFAAGDKAMVNLK